MSHVITLELPDELYELLVRQAERRGQTTEELVLDRLRSVAVPPSQPSKETQQEAVERFLRKHAGAISVPDSTGGDNESIDRDLAREYESTHEDE